MARLARWSGVPGDVDPTTTARCRDPVAAGLLERDNLTLTWIDSAVAVTPTRRPVWSSTHQARAVCERCSATRFYRATLLACARAGTHLPAIETMLWHYAYGKPTDIVDVTVSWATELMELM